MGERELQWAKSRGKQGLCLLLPDYLPFPDFLYLPFPDFLYVPQPGFLIIYMLDTTPQLNFY